MFFAVALSQQVRSLSRKLVTHGHALASIDVFSAEVHRIARALMACLMADTLQSQDEHQQSVAGTLLQIVLALRVPTCRFI